MAKTKTAYFCKSCGYESPKWLGKCSSCNEWNSFTEEVISIGSSGKIVSNATARSIPFKDAAGAEFAAQRIPAGAELNRVLGGGIVSGSVILLGGEPGIGKSTLLLQTALQDLQISVLYVSGEESAEQIGLRAQRIGQKNDACTLLIETQVEAIIKVVETERPRLVIIDSIQTMHTSLIDSAAGSVSQIRESASMLMRMAKESKIPVLLVGHVTKDGHIAGPKLLEHMVDVVLQFEGDRQHLFRIVRALKNRFGATHEIGIYEMTTTGLSEVQNPSGHLLSGRDANLSGTVTGVIMEGARPLLLETQALVSSAVYGTPQRSATGFDLRRLNMLLAVLEKRCGFRIGASDVFLNLTGGLSIDDPGLDLAVVAAILSSGENTPIAQNQCFSAEVGLTGELRPVNRLEQRIAEADKLGFKVLYTSGYNLKGIDRSRYSIEIVGVNKIDALYQRLF